MLIKKKHVGDAYKRYLSDAYKKKAFFCDWLFFIFLIILHIKPYYNKPVIPIYLMNINYSRGYAEGSGGCILLFFVRGYSINE